MVLAAVPPDMGELYRRVLNFLSETTLDRRLTRVILKWAVCSARPLTTEELHTALEIKLDDTMHDVQRAVQLDCGQLVYFDAQRRIQLLHLTTKDILTNTAVNSEFVINEDENHMSLTLVCLK